MKPTTLLVAAVAVLVVVTGAAAAAPAGIAAADNGDTADTADMSAPADAAGQAGPPEDLPGPVPDFVSDILSAVNGFVDRSVDSLGSTVSDISGGAQADDTTEGDS
jgi:hypothetical protein